MVTITGDNDTENGLMASEVADRAPAVTRGWQLARIFLVSVLCFNGITRFRLVSYANYLITDQVGPNFGGKSCI